MAVQVACSGSGQLLRGSGLGGVQALGPRAACCTHCHGSRAQGLRATQMSQARTPALQPTRQPSNSNELQSTSASRVPVTRRRLRTPLAPKAHLHRTCCCCTPCRHTGRPQHRHCRRSVAGWHSAARRARHGARPAHHHCTTGGGGGRGEGVLSALPSCPASRCHHCWCTSRYYPAGPAGPTASCRCTTLMAALCTPPVR